MRERDIERYLVERVKALGGECRKVQWIGRRGAPDRVVWLADGREIWIELKAPGAKPEPHQAREHERMRSMGRRVEVVDSHGRVDEVLAKQAADPQHIDAALRAAVEAEREACAALCDSKVMALDHGGKEYYRPATADQCAAAIRARGNSAGRVFVEQK